MGSGVSVGSHPASGRSSYDSMAPEMVPVGAGGWAGLSSAPVGLPPATSTPAGGLGAVVSAPAAGDAYKRSKSFAAGVGSGGDSGRGEGEGARPALVSQLRVCVPVCCGSLFAGSWCHPYLA
jgi:hypothetical protein